MEPSERSGEGRERGGEGAHRQSAATARSRFVNGADSNIFSRDIKKLAEKHFLHLREHILANVPAFANI